ncbi:MAG: hypothetical protein ACRDP6_40125 [Actinoallomurus sp.]
MRDLESARKIADAVLYEGYLLYPYRASAVKNQVRWQFGVYVPPGFTVTEEPSAGQTECLIEGGEFVHVRSRFLHVQARTSEGAEPYDEATEREVDAGWSLAELLEGERVHDIRIPGGSETADGVTRTWQPLNARVRAAAERLPGPYGVVRLRLRLENTGAWTGEERAEALRHSLVAAHTLIALTGGVFLSLADPPEWARPAAESCENLHTWPVLMDDDLVLSSPIILEDRPSIAPESPGDLFDATEIDEILSLRTLTLTDEEKREARATDPRAAEIIDRVDAMPPELIERLHGAIRSPGPRRGWDTAPDEVPVFTTEKPWWDPGADASVDPETDRITVAGVEVGRGSKVRLQPAGRADAQDMFVVGRTATVEAVLFDVDGSQHLAVTIDDDPGTDLRRAQGRYWYFAPDDVEPL